MFDYFKLVSMRGKAIWISMMMLISLVFLTWTSFDISAAFQANRSIQLININMQKQFLMNRIMTALGYGGAIQAFKDYELRRRDKFHTQTLEGLTKSESLIHSYLKLGKVSKQEAQKLGEILELIGLIKISLLPMKQMLQDRVTSLEIDKQLAIDYAPYRASIDDLLGLLRAKQAQELQALKQQDAFLGNQISGLNDHISIFNTVTQSMGYGGIIHLYKNYILHGHSYEYDRYKVQLASMKISIQALAESDLHVAGENDLLFESLSQLPQRYDEAIEKQKSLQKAGVAFNTLVFKGRVKEDKVYIKSLNQLNGLLTLEFIEQQKMTARYLNDLVQNSEKNLMMSIIVIFICIALAIYLFAIRMPRLMVESIDAVNRSVGCDVSEMQLLTGRKDEFGALACAIEASSQMLIEAEVKRQDLAAQEKSRDADEQRAMRVFHREELAGDFEKTLGVILTEVSSYVQQAHAQAKTVNEMSTQLILQSDNANKSSQKGIIYVEATENASNDIQNAVLDIGEKSKSAYSLAGEVMQETNAIHVVVERLNVLSQRIGTVVQSISSIAKNTRLLSMNATIEGASAGEAGKGFAVVATEVKELSKESAKAVEHIHKEISNMQDEISSTASLLVGMIEKISAVHEGSLRVADSVEIQVEAMQGVASNAEQASHRMQDVVRVIDVLSNAAGDSGNSSAELYGLIEKVNERMEQAESSLQIFLLGMRNSR
ncbi:MAG: methyl-accepting chemotaxis protein [Mariprofundaceae bacterium]